MCPYSKLKVKKLKIEYIQLVSSGARNKEIANKLSISEHTVKAHISSIFRKTQARNRVELLRWAQSFQSHLDLFALTH